MFDIEPFVYRRFLDVYTYGSPATDLRVDCMKCGDTKRHLYVSLVKETVHCFKCGYTASWVNFVRDVTGYGYYHALGELYVKPRAVDFGHALDKILYSKDTPTENAILTYNLPKDFINIEHVPDTKMARKAIGYLNTRGFGMHYWRRYNIGLADSVPYRIIIPIDKGYWQGRRMFKWMDPKYINPGQPSRDAIFNASALSLAEVVVTEGAFSAMAVGENAIALLGKDPPVEKVGRILASPATSFILAVEPDAYPTMRKLADTLYKAGKDVTIWSYSQGDPADPSGEFKVYKYSLKSDVFLRLYS